MEDNRHNFWEKLAKEVSGNASEEDKSLLRQQREQDKEFGEAATQAEKVWRSSALQQSAYEPDVDSGWQRFQFRLQTRTPQVPVRKQRDYTWPAAATLLLLLMAGLYAITQMNKHAWTEVSTANNETKTIMLADGSKVSLNENSTFAYPSDFQKANRTVRLKGEAFFEVAKAEGKRFTIFAKDTKTEVIGTSFNVSAYENAAVKVQVVTGKVAFSRTGTEDAVFLVPGQEGIMPENGMMPKKKSIQDPNFQAWKTHNLAFNNQRLENLAEELESYFNVEIIIQNEDLKNCRFTTSFKDPELKEVFEILALTGNLKISRDGSRYIISGKGCN